MPLIVIFFIPLKCLGASNGTPCFLRFLYVAFEIPIARSMAFILRYFTPLNSTGFIISPTRDHKIQECRRAYHRRNDIPNDPPSL